MGLFKVPTQFKILLLLLYLMGSNSTDANIPRKLHVGAVDRGVGGSGDIASTGNSVPPPPPPPPQAFQARSNTAPFKPSVAVVVAVLTTMFSVTFLILLYAKHCKRGNEYSNNSGGGGRAPPLSGRKNSGVDRSVIESLPIFRFRSLQGEKDGLECAVCLNRFEPAEVLRLLPKCNHAFHVECVDTWLDAHSTCPLCRYRVDPEDILLLHDSAAAKIRGQNEPPLPLQPPQPPQPPPPPPLCEENQRFERLRRMSGRHSSAGERGTGGGGGFFQIVLHRPVSDSSESTRREIIGGGNNNDNNNNINPLLITRRRSLDSWNLMRNKKNAEVVSVGCFDRQIRKDGLLITRSKEKEEEEEERRRRRLEHRIIIGEVGGAGSGFRRRWSDAQSSDLLYLRSEMIMSDSRRFSASGSRSSANRQQQQHQNQLLPVHINHGAQQNGRSVISGRSMSEFTGLSRFGNTITTGNNHHHCYHQEQRRQHHRPRWQREEGEEQRRAGMVSRWRAWISQSPLQTQEAQPDVRS
ncbi:RING-type E3 ubiquitin transferase [Sarracenia purpurea var. burkii]